MDTCKRIGMLRRRRVWEIIESGTADDIVSCCYAEDQRYPGFGRGRTEGQYQHRLKEIVRLKHDPRNGMRIRDLDISWQTIIVWSGTTVL